jgi:hypothetical protein
MERLSKEIASNRKLEAGLIPAFAGLHTAHKLLTRDCLE